MQTLYKNFANASYSVDKLMSLPKVGFDNNLIEFKV